jgi:hypothetical protein
MDAVVNAKDAEHLEEMDAVVNAKDAEHTETVAAMREEHRRELELALAGRQKATRDAAATAAEMDELLQEAIRTKMELVEAQSQLSSIPSSPLPLRSSSLSPMLLQASPLPALELVSAAVGAATKVGAAVEAAGAAGAVKAVGAGADAAEVVGAAATAGGALSQGGIAVGKPDYGHEGTGTEPSDALPLSPHPRAQVVFSKEADDFVTVLQELGYGSVAMQAQAQAQAQGQGHLQKPAGKLKKWGRKLSWKSPERGGRKAKGGT